MSKSPVTCHVLDSSIGKPASGVKIYLEEYNQPTIGAFELMAEGETDSDGRCLTLLRSTEAEEKMIPLKAGGLYKIIFKTKEYFESTGRKSFYPWVEISFEIVNPDEHYHIPLLISPFSFTTYRGS